MLFRSMKIRNQELRDKCNIQDVVGGVRGRRRAWRDHVNRMVKNRMANIAMTNNPQTTRPRGRPLKRWKDSWTWTSQGN